MMGEMRDNTKGNDEFEQRSSPDKKPAQDYLGNKTVPKPKPFSGRRKATQPFLRNGPTETNWLTVNFYYVTDWPRLNSAPFRFFSLSRPFWLSVTLYSLKPKRKGVKKWKGADFNQKVSSFIIPSTDRYLNYYTTSLVIFVKDKLSQLVFIAFHFRVCILASTVDPLIEEYFIFIFFTGLVVNEIQQYKESPGKYFK